MIKFNNVFINTSQNRERLQLNVSGDMAERSYKNKSVSVDYKNGVMRASASIKQIPFASIETFDADRAVSVEIEIDGADGAVGITQNKSPFWCEPIWSDSLNNIVENMRAVLVRSDDEYIFVLPLCNDELYSSVGPGDKANTLQINISKLCGGYIDIIGAVAVITTGENPYEVIKRGYQIAVDNYLINTVLRTDKKYPKMFEYLGWCSWNAFYHDINSKKIAEKMNEFYKKGIPVRWIIADDGWSSMNFENLANSGESFPVTINTMEEDFEKFPGGLKVLIENLKANYGLKWFGIWHSFTAYWKGIAHNSDFYNHFSSLITKTNSGYYIPDPEHSKEFYTRWHSYLKECGVDFLKVDTQGNAVEYMRYTPDACKKIKQLYDGFGASVDSVFDDNIINCMALNAFGVYNSGKTSLTRSSDDFYPDKADGFKSHALQNAYNSLFLSDILFCDYDMWWSNHKTAVQSGMLRAISGGPVYVSDKLGDSVAQYIEPLIENDGRILRGDNVGRPTFDCLFCDMNNDDVILKLFNTKGDDGAVALFNLSEKTLEVVTSPKDFGGIGKYAAYAYSEKAFSTADEIRVTLRPGESEIVNFYKVHDGSIYVGDLSKYLSVGSKTKRQVDIKSAKIGQKSAKTG